MAKKKTHEEYVAELAIKNPTVQVIGQYINARTPIDHYCLTHDVVWQAYPDNVLRGMGCKECRKIRLGNKLRKTTEEYKNELININPNIDVLEEYIDAKTPILHKCKLDEYEWLASPDSILRGTGCPLCAKKRISESKRKTHQEYVIDVAKVNPNIEVIGQYVNSQTPVLHRCKKDGCEWMARPYNILNGYGCPTCQESKGERAIKKWLESYKIQYIHQKRFDDCKDILPLPFDFYLPEYNICIEYNGEQHYRPVDFAGKGQEWAEQQLVKTQAHDQIKSQYCEDNNIRLLVIPYYKNIEEELNNFLFI